MKAQKSLEQKIKDYMIENIIDHIDVMTNEADTTGMAQDAINALAAGDWEAWHDEYHPVWDIAVDVAEEMGHGIVI